MRQEKEDIGRRRSREGEDEAKRDRGGRRSKEEPTEGKDEAGAQAKDEIWDITYGTSSGSPT